MSDVLTPEKERFADMFCGTGMLTSNVEGNCPNYVASVLRYSYLGKPLDITGFYLEVPQRTVIKQLENAEVISEVTLLGTVRVLHLTGDVERYEMKGNHKTVNEVDPYEMKYTKVLEVKSGDMSRKFFVDAEVSFIDQFWD